MDILQLVFYFLVIVPSSIIHEYAHGLMAEHLGDSTARYAGRLTIDPRAHIDLWGTILLPVLLYLSTGFMFAYAKPVPYNPYNLKNQKWGPALVALAGPLSNFLLAFAFAVMFRLLPAVSALRPFVGVVVYANVLLMVFNLVPIPPLDGSKVLFAFLPYRLNHVIAFLEQYGFVLLLFFMVFLFNLIHPVIDLVIRLLLGF